MEQLKHMKQTLMSCVQGQLGDLASVDAQELGAAVDMIKDLSEAIYYCTITESMEKQEKEGSSKKDYPMMYYPQIEYRYYPMEYAQGGGNSGGGGSRNYMEYRDMDRDMGRLYYNGGGSSGGSGGGNSSGGNSGGGSRGYQDGNRQSAGESRNYPREYPVELRDYREGRSPMTRKNYMENKEIHKDKASQMQELEKYMTELSQDITEMIEGSSPEEKQILQRKLSALATKIV